MAINTETTICVYGPEEQYIPFLVELIELAFKKPKEIDLQEISDTMVLYTKTRNHRIYSGVMDRINNHRDFNLTDIKKVQGCRFSRRTDPGFSLRSDPPFYVPWVSFESRHSISPSGF